MARRNATFKAQLNHNLKTAQAVKLKIDEINAKHGVIASMVYSPLDCKVYIASGKYDIFGSKRIGSTKKYVLADNYGVYQTLNEGNEYLNEVVNVLKSANWVTYKQEGIERQIWWRVLSFSEDDVPYVTTAYQQTMSAALTFSVPVPVFKDAALAIYTLENLPALLEDAEYKHRTVARIFRHMIQSATEPNSEVSNLDQHTPVIQQLQSNQIDVMVNDKLVIVTPVNHG